MRPGVTSLLEALRTFRALSSGIFSASASTTPKRTPISRLARRFWLGSRTSLPLITKSNLSFGPMAANAERLPRPAFASASAETEAADVRNCLREAANTTISSIIFSLSGACTHPFRRSRKVDPCNPLNPTCNSRHPRIPLATSRSRKVSNLLHRHRPQMNKASSIQPEALAPLQPTILP
jgi:hypothetical protein